MKFTVISDTHGKHGQLVLPDGDVLLHAGDVSSRGLQQEVDDFLQWFAVQPFQYKIFIAGNHDFFFEQATQAEIDGIIPPGVIYLNDSGVTINNINIWGSPISPWFYDWAFNRHRGTPIRQHWDKIPLGTDLLVTHGPAFEHLDMTSSGLRVGCEDLAEQIEKIQPVWHICGHIHEAYGIQENSSTSYINASVLNERYECVNEPVIFEYTAGEATRLR